LPFEGAYNLPEILRTKERLAAEIEADWFIHHDVDEIREAPLPYTTLLEGFKDANHQGYNAINFDEFVFLPTDENESFEKTDYVKTMRYYYFFQPRPFHRITAWKKTDAPANIVNSGGHRVDFKGRKIFPKPFILRHYIALSRAHALRKYGNRIYSEETIKRGWSRVRRNFSAEKLNFQKRERLKQVTGDRIWDKSDPWTNHEFLHSDCSPKRSIKQFVISGFAASNRLAKNVTGL
jgi:hypothetical protein